MRVISTLMCLVLLGAPAWAQDCKLIQAASLPLNNVGDILTVNATLDGVPAPLAFSLGGEDIPMNQLYKSFTDAHKFQIQRANFGDVRIVQSRNLAELNLATIHQFDVGGIKGTNLDFLIEPEDQPSPELVGSLRQASFSGYDFELDIAGKKLNLFLQSHCPGQVVYWPTTVVARLPFLSTDNDGRFQMELDGKPLRVLLSPNNSASFLGSKAFHRIFGLDLSSPGVTRVASSSDSDPLYAYHFSTLAMDAINIRDPSITIFVQKGYECLDKPNLGIGSRIDSEQIPGCFGGHDLTLGSPIMRQLRFFFSNKERVLYVTPAVTH